ncbi:MAG: hypothetical protein JO199_01005 [Candidatus Eremiobacteraeota bacterium]|nr:hypothetical protein [Candidatus Eremiobacteraeota bacterium]
MRRHFLMGSLVAAAALLTACNGGSNLGSNGAFVPQSQNRLTPRSTNVIQNAGFETGKIAPWTIDGQRTGEAKIVNTQWHSGKYSVYMGTDSVASVNGPHGIEQSVTVPANATLSFWHEGNSTDEVKYGYDEIDVLQGTKVLGVCYGGSGVATDTVMKWKQSSCSMSKYAGKKVTLFFYVNDNGYKGYWVNWYLDDITLTGK